LAIQQVKSVGTQDRNDLDYGASADQPSIDKAGCGFGFLRSFDPTAGILEAQRLAEGDPNSKAFDDPDQVASGFLRARLRLDPAVPIQLKETRRTAGRLVYQWQRPSKQEFDMVVVSRPYLLSFYALDPKRVAWVVIAAYESSCAKGKQVTRIR